VLEEVLEFVLVLEEVSAEVLELVSPEVSEEVSMLGVEVASELVSVLLDESTGLSHAESRKAPNVRTINSLLSGFMFRISKIIANAYKNAKLIFILASKN